VWTKASSRRRTGNGVAVHARQRFKGVHANFNLRVLVSGLALIPGPCGKVVWGINIDANQHLRELHSAKLSALSQVESWVKRINPKLVDTVRDEVRFPGKLRHPEAVIDVCGQQLEIGRVG
jgi:hypothetical protein